MESRLIGTDRDYYRLTDKPKIIGSSVGVSGKLACDHEIWSFKSGDVKGTIPEAVRYPFVSNDVRRHRLMSISYISLLLCHGTARGNGREQEAEGIRRRILRGRSSSGYRLRAYQTLGGCTGLAGCWNRCDHEYEHPASREPQRSSFSNHGYSRPRARAGLVCQ